MRRLKTITASAVLLAILAVPTILRSQSTTVVPHESETRTQIQSQLPDSEINCMADAIYYEAGHESIEGQEAVGRVIKNRVRHGFSKTVCGVVNQGAGTKYCQFKFRCVNHPTPPLPKLYIHCRELAKQILLEDKYSQVVPKTALFFHAKYVHPTWPHYKQVAEVGNHVFYAKLGN